MTTSMRFSAAGDADGARSSVAGTTSHSARLAGGPGGVPPSAAPWPEVVTEPGDDVSHQLVQHYPEPAAVFRADGLCSCLNPAAARSLGVVAPHALGLRPGELGLPAPVAALIAARPRGTPVPTDTEVAVACDRGTAVRQFRITRHGDRGETLVTWTDHARPAEVARQIDALRAALAGQRQLARAASERNREVIDRLQAQLRQAVAALEDLAVRWRRGPGPAGADAAAALEAELWRLHTALGVLAGLGRAQLAVARANQAGPIVEL